VTGAWVWGGITVILAVLAVSLVVTAWRQSRTCRCEACGGPAAGDWLRVCSRCGQVARKWTEMTGGK
jgi:hypothetical protein